jgi:endoglucanase
MINQRFFQVLLTILLLLPGYSSAQGISTTSTDQYCIPKEFIRASGRQLVVGPEDTPVRLKGVCFGNEVWGNPATPPAKHHVERDYARVREMKMNVIRFYLNYGLFEDDRHPYKYKASGWAWLDRNIRWAKKNGVYLILTCIILREVFNRTEKAWPCGISRRTKIA